MDLVEFKESEKDNGSGIKADNEGWCNTCEYKNYEAECLGCAKYDENDNLIALNNYKKEGKK